MLERLVWAEINVRNFLYNISCVKKIVGSHVKIMAVVKANAYGHGAVELAKVAEKFGVDYFGIVCLYEARQLREAGIHTPILVLNYIDEESVEACVDLNVTLNVMDEKLLSRLDKVARKKGKRVPIHVKVDTGMHRLGLQPEEALRYIPKIEQYKNIKLEGVFTHFATSDEKNLSFTYSQLKTFNTLLSALAKNGVRVPIVHAANSAATLRVPSAHYDLVRPGVILYGLAPSGDFPLPFIPKPVMALKTKIVQLRQIAKGETVGYGRTFTAVKPTRVASLPVGYADGFRRAPNNWGSVLVNGQFAPLIGRVSMDQSSIDVTAIRAARVGDEVVLIGIQGKHLLTAELVAKTLGTINYEVTSAIASRVSRVYFL